METSELSQKIFSIVAGDTELFNLSGYLQAIYDKPEELLEKLSLVAQLKSAMKEGVVHFVFQKLNGEVREAYGTRAEDILKQNNSTPQGARKSLTTFPYYDIEKKDWRCFKPELLKSISTSYTI